MTPEVFNSSGAGRSKGCLYRALLRSGSGAALVELALVGTMLVTILLGAAEFAMLAYDSIEVSDAARAGAGYGSESTGAASDSAGIRSVAAKSANDVSALTTTPTVFYSCSSTPSTQNATQPTCGSGDSVLTYIQVTTAATISMPIHIPGLSSYTVNGKAIMRVQ
jgi:Flp pilus assembly protein TadG